jgi:hypothetical protein
VGYDPAHWHDLFVMLGGASAALAGLIFVGLSIHARAVAKDRLHRLRARNLTAGILYILLASGLVLTPGQGNTALGIELVIGGCVIGGLFAQPPLQYWGQLDADLRIRMTIALLACAVSVFAGISLIVGAGGGLYVLGAAAVLGLVMNVFGAWSLLLGLSRDA